MSRLPDPLPGRIEAALSDATPEELHRIDQLAALLRDWYDDRQLDLSTREVSQASLTALTVVYALLQAAHSQGEINDEAWQAINDVVSSAAAAVTVTRAGAALAAPHSP